MKKLPSGTYTKAQFANHLGLAENQFIFVCVKSNIVREVQVCYQTTATGNSVKACTKSTTTCTGGGATIVLESFAIKAQTRVFDYAKALTYISE